ncbi:hypothetical protein NLM27_32280 [Bradyrhizobium sp. CCGB12]|uniref:hypothetical protein n=1 Tax=Bradyrhizobium sp. CCGB12 TaxID=2949632 RepID=UPI0020B2777C|nr:hypothetical protein [Bradyrhizobium sp. CCGB12]MCP3393436.1 hypothetical protein [Bradyrhizobium sp. CCGB12]
MLKKLVVMAVLSGLVAYGLLLTDWPAPRSQHTGYFAVAPSQKADLSHLDDWNRAAKAKYGPNASTAMHGRKWVTVVGDKVVDTRPFAWSVYGFSGVFMVSRVESFPFELSLDPRDAVDPQQTAAQVKTRFAGTVPAEALEFGSREWRPALCHYPKPPDFGFPLPSSALSVDASTICLMRSGAEGSHTALIGFARVDASFWVRLLSRRVCRILSASWIESMMSRPDSRRPDYVACMLATKAEGAEHEAVTARFFEVREDRTLAAFD